MKKLSALLPCLTLSVCLQAAQLPVALNSATTFTVLAGSTVTNTGFTTVIGDVGVSPGSALTGFPPGTVSGGAIHVDDGPAVSAQADLTTAYNDAAGRMTPTIVAGDLSGQTLPPGLYKSTSSLGIAGVLTLDGQGSANSVFIFQVASSLTTGTGSQVVLIGNANAANIFWQVGSSATLGTYSVFSGTIMAQASVSLATGAALNGRALARDRGGHIGFQSDGQPRSADHDANATGAGRHVSAGHCPSRCSVQLVSGGHGRHAALHVFNHGIAAAGFEPDRFHRTSHWDPDWSGHRLLWHQSSGLRIGYCDQFLQHRRSRRPGRCLDHQDRADIRCSEHEHHL